MKGPNNRADYLRSEIAQLEARYDDHFPPGVYAVLEQLRHELALMEKDVLPTVGDKGSQ